MIIIKDTREKIGAWNFTGFSECSGQIVDTVPTGDYLIKGHETLITIDRKRRPAELANNLGKYKERFTSELKRMQDYKFRYVICEFPYEKLLMFPKGSGLPTRVQKQVRARGKFLCSQVEKMSEEYGVEFIFCANRIEAQEKAMELFREALESEKQ